MWNKLHLGTFKAFKEIDIELGPLTVLAGINSAGKSSVLQALALLNQTILDNDFNQHFCLSGFNLALGTVEDIANHNYSRRQFEIGLRDEKLESTWHAAALDRKEGFLAVIKSMHLNGPEMNENWSDHNATNIDNKLRRLFPEQWHLRDGISAFGDSIEKIKYLSSERVGPRDAYPVLPSPRLATVGPRGQFCAAFIDTFGDDTALMSSALGERATVKKMVDEFVDSFFPGYTVEPRRIDRTNLISMFVIDPSNNLNRAQSVGFGISHALPILVQCAGARKGDTLLIESPESYLHPAAQSKMGQFLAMTAFHGIQVIVETHSDHVINGIRRAVASARIDAEDVCINFVSREREAIQPTYERVELTREGRLQTWPKGFFDQIEQDLISLP